VAAVIRDNFGLVVLVFVLMLLLGFMWLFRGDRDMLLASKDWVLSVLGGIGVAVTGKFSHAMQANISDSAVSVENSPTK